MPVTLLGRVTRMDMKNFNPDCLLEIARKNLPFILQNELENDVPLNYIDENGQYVFRYKDGTILPASLEISFKENWDRHRTMLERTNGAASAPAEDTGRDK